MLARRIIVLSPEKAFAKRLATALKAAGGAVDMHISLDELGKGELQAALVVLHLDGEIAKASADLMSRVTGDARVIAVVPKSNLEAIVDVMQSSDRIAGLLVAEELDLHELSAMATRILAGDIFGLEKVARWGTLVHSQLIGDYQEKSQCISQISEFAEQMGVRRKYREAIEQCVDEMLMNALYDAPVDENGKQIFAEIPTKTRISLRVEQKVVVQYACDGSQFIVSVRDAFGTLERGTVLKYLYKCLHAPADQQIDRKMGGAGLGLYLMVNSASTVYFNVLPGVATEAVCVFDLEKPKLQLEHFGFFTEKIDAAGRLAAGASRRLPQGASHPVERRARGAAAPTSRGLVLGLSAAIAAMIVLIGFVAYSKLSAPTHTMTKVTFTTQPKGATIDVDGSNVGTAKDGTLAVDLEVGRAYPVVARLEGYEPAQAVVKPHEGANQMTLALKALAATVDIDTQPTGATVELDGKPLGTTPLSVTTLPPGMSATLTFKKAGYNNATATLEVPGPGRQLRLVQPMQVSEDLARIKITSDPPGAQVAQNGQLLAGVTTPAEVLVEAGKVQRFTLTLPKHVPAMIEPFTPERGADGVVKNAKLVAGEPLTVDSTIEGKVAISPAPHCREMTTPAECVVSPGSYTVDLVVPGSPKITHTVKVGTAPKTDRFELGWVEAGEKKSLQLGGATLKKVALPAGAHQLTVADEAGTHNVTVHVKAGATVVAN